jgi:hypothetical protein
MMPNKMIYPNLVECNLGATQEQLKMLASVDGGFAARESGARFAREGAIMSATLARAAAAVVPNSQATSFVEGWKAKGEI